MTLCLLTKVNTSQLNGTYSIILCQFIFISSFGKCDFFLLVPNQAALSAVVAYIWRVDGKKSSLTILACANSVLVTLKSSSLLTNILLIFAADWSASLVEEAGEDASQHVFVTFYLKKTGVRSKPWWTLCLDRSLDSVFFELGAMYALHFFSWWTNNDIFDK